jgi:hypothetical protein
VSPLGHLKTCLIDGRDDLVTIEVFALHGHEFGFEINRYEVTPSSAPTSVVTAASQCPQVIPGTVNVIVVLMI